MIEDRTKVERRIAVYLASEETTGSPDTTPFPERAKDIYENFVQPAIEQAQAEVLAACIEGAKVYFDDFRDVPPPPITVEEVIRFLRGVQPAASALKELLREARGKGHIEGHECDNLVIEIDEDGKVKGCSYKIDALRKKKARALSWNP